MTIVRLVSAVALVAWATATVSAQSLGEIARKEEERRKAIKASGKVYTDADLRRFGALPQPVDQTTPPAALPATPAVSAAGETAGGRPAADAPVGPGGQASQAAAEATPAPEPERDQAWWRGKFTEARGKLASARAIYQALVMQHDLLGLAMTEDPAERARIDREREQVKLEAERLKTDVETLTRALAMSEGDARRANVPPGWIR